jgi:quercetin dioxygenase-like cupin family protein
MVLEPSKSEGNAQNRHAGADQWLLVVSGSGVATINRRRYPLRPMTLLLIEHGDRHEIRNTAARGALAKRQGQFRSEPATRSDSFEIITPFPRRRASQLCL